MYPLANVLVVSDGVGGFVCIPFFVQSRAGSIVVALFAFTNASMNYRVSSQVDRAVLLLNAGFWFQELRWFFIVRMASFSSSGVIKPLDSSW